MSHDDGNNHGRTAIAHDWQSLCAAAPAADHDAEWGVFAATVADRP